jgi:hypothetical protein
MAEIISIENFPATNIGEITILTADAAAAQAVINVENADGLVVDDFLLIGFKGQETTELKKIQSITNLAVTNTANLVNKHYKNESVARVRADKAKIYRAANVDGSQPADGSFSLLQTVTLEADQLYTEYVDSAGGSGYWYKYTFYNSVTTLETSLSEAVAVRGGAYGLYATTDEVRIEAGLQNNRYIADQQIYAKLVQAQSEVNGSLTIGGYSLPLTDIPEDVKNATLLLAAGYLLVMDYGAEHQGTNKDGEKKLKLGKELLAKFEAGQTPLVTAGGSVITGGNKAVNFYPTDTEAAKTPEEGGRMFSTGIKF